MRCLRGDAAQHERDHEHAERDQAEHDDGGAGRSGPAAALQAIDERTAHRADDEPGDQRVDDARGLLDQPDRTDEHKDHPDHEP
jgi:hypothetical protein